MACGGEGITKVLSREIATSVQIRYLAWHTRPDPTPFPLTEMPLQQLHTVLSNNSLNSRV
jgi:hypothetical protein